MYPLLSLFRQTRVITTAPINPIAAFAADNTCSSVASFYSSTSQDTTVDRGNRLRPSRFPRKGLEGGVGILDFEPVFTVAIIIVSLSRATIFGSRTLSLHSGLPESLFHIPAPFPPFV